MNQTEQFEGQVVDKQGKTHHIFRITCLSCNRVLVEMHYNCCGYTVRGFQSFVHACPRDTESHANTLAVKLTKPKDFQRHGLFETCEQCDFYHPCQACIKRNRERIAMLPEPQDGDTFVVEVEEPPRLQKIK